MHVHIRVGVCMLLRVALCRRCMRVCAWIGYEHGEGHTHMHMHMYPQGLIWRTADGRDGSFRNNEQKGVA